MGHMYSDGYTAMLYWSITWNLLFGFTPILLNTMDSRFGAVKVPQGMIRRLVYICISMSTTTWPLVHPKPRPVPMNSL